MPPLVSIITPFRDAAPFLAEAIESVLGQNDIPNWELILVDDGSRDESADIARRFVRKDARIKLAAHPGPGSRGSSAARNLGIAHARAERIALLDADDVWLPGTLRYQVETLDRHPAAAMVFGTAERWFSWDPSQPVTADFVVPAMVPGIGADTLIPPPQLLRAYLRDESVTPCTCTVMLRRTAVERAGAFEESFSGLYDDQVFYAKICLCEPVFVSSRCLARYRQHFHSCCATARRNGTGERGRAAFLSWLRGYTNACLE